MTLDNMRMKLNMIDYKKKHFIFKRKVKQNYFGVQNYSK